jgi:hypothetical protein
MRNIKNAVKILIVLSTIVLSLPIKAQQQWKFHIAFEDATMARDTIWYIWDTTATFEGADTLLNEVSHEFDYDKFNVWTYNPGLFYSDSIKTLAFPYEFSLGGQIDAMNFELPIKITWDSSLFHAPWLPSTPVGWVNSAGIGNDYFFMINNVEVGGFFDMTITDSIIAPEPDNPDPWFWLPARHFPMGIAMSQDPSTTIDVPRANINAFFRLDAYPNPFNNNVKLKIESPNPNEPLTISVIDLFGRLLHQAELSGAYGNYDGPVLQELERKFNIAPPGFYIAVLQSKQSIINSIKIVKLK